MPSRADTHDLDKLRRWHKDLEAIPDGAPPVFAIFLVSREDRAAHDAFRAFRSSFEESNVGFAHLVIFGQHGLSNTAKRLKAKFGLAVSGGPSLVLFLDDSGQPRIVALPQGEEGVADGADAYGWQEALERAKSKLGERISREAAVLETLREICVELGDGN